MFNSILHLRTTCPDRCKEQARISEGCLLALVLSLHQLCNMDRYGPEDCIEPSTTQSLEDTKDFISHIRSKNSKLVQPVLTPRFALSSTDGQLRGLGELAKLDSTLAIQTHISGNRIEIEETLKVFPITNSYTDVYDKFGLLTKRTILGHGVHLENKELDLIKRRDTGISHCPTSNFNLTSGMARVGEMLDRGTNA
jgi:guanine deaminase